MHILITFVHAYFSSLIPKMSVSTLAISCLTMSNLPWFMDLTFQVPMQYCSLQCQTWFSPPDTEHLYHFGAAISLLLELLVIALCSSPVAYWTSFSLGALSSAVTSFCLFIHFAGFLRQGYWSCLPFLLPLECFLSELSTVIHPSWLALHGMAHSFLELNSPHCYDTVVVHEGAISSRLSNLLTYSYSFILWFFF